jgi:hypothetical protein
MKLLQKTGPTISCIGTNFEDRAVNFQKKENPNSPAMHV